MTPTEREELNYLLDNMVFSFSNLQAFTTCPRMWELKYVKCLEGEDNIYSKFGTCCHHILQDYTDGKIKKADIPEAYTKQFALDVDDCPPDFMNERLFSFYNRGLDYFDYEAQESVVERILNTYDKKYHKYETHTEYYFEYVMPSNGHKFCGYIDLLILFYDKKGNVIDAIVADHKSGESPMHSKTGTIKKNQIEKFTQYKRQLMVYADFVKTEFGFEPNALVLNYLRDKKLIKLIFDQREYEEAMEWVSQTIDTMYTTDVLDMEGSYFFCKTICDYRNGGC